MATPLRHIKVDSDGINVGYQEGGRDTWGTADVLPGTKISVREEKCLRKTSAC